MPVKIKDAEGNEHELLTATEQAEMVTGAIKSHTKKLGDDITKGLATTIADLKLDEKIADAVKKQAPPPPNPDDDRAKKPDPEIEALKARLADSDKRFETAENARKAAEEKSRDDSARSALRTALQTVVRPEALEATTKLLFDADKRVTFGEDGRPLLTVRRAPHPGAAEEDVQMPLADGVAHWAKSSEAKLFIPPPKGAPETGPRGSQRDQRSVSRGNDGLPVYEGEAKTDDERFRRADERQSAIADRLAKDGLI